MVKDKIQFKLKDKIFLFLAISGLILAFYFRIFDSDSSSNKLHSWESLSSLSQKENLKNEEFELRIRDVFLQVEIAEKEDERIKGLSKRDSLDMNSGMLFLFKEKGNHSFVMRDMNLDLDFIFINNGEIVELIKKIPSDFEGTIKGSSYYDKVIEVNAGWVDLNGVTIGDDVFFKN